MLLLHEEPDSTTLPTFQTRDTAAHPFGISLGTSDSVPPRWRA